MSRKRTLRLFPFFLFLFCITILNANTRPPGEWTQLRFSDDAALHLAGINSRADQLEQRRDWLLLAAAADFGALDSASALAGLYDQCPLRTDYLYDVTQYQWGESRSLALPGNRLLLLMPAEAAVQRRLTAMQVDKYRMTTGGVPDTVLLYEYNIGGIDEYRFAGATPGMSFFTRDWGYVEKTITTRDEWAAFLSEVDDLSWVKLDTENRLVVAGRRYKGLDRPVTLEHLKTIYDALSVSDDLYFSLEPRLREQDLASQFDRIASGDARIWDELNRQKGFRISLALAIHALLNDVSYRIEFARIALGVGEKDFSELDLLRRYLAGSFDSIYVEQFEDDRDYIRRDVDEMLASFEKNDTSSERCQIGFVNRLLHFKKLNNLPQTPVVDSLTWLLLTREAPEVRSKLDSLNYFIEYMVSYHSFQQPEYSRGLAGTEVGMIMFYTDFFMKGESQKIVAPALASVGNFNETWSAFSRAFAKKYPHERLWFSPADDAFQRVSDDELGFAYAAAQVNFKARPNAFFGDDKEVDMQYNLDNFHAAWNRYFDHIARFEPEIHRLSQLMKWVAVVRFARARSPQTFDLIKDEKVRRDWLLPQWYAQQPALAFKALLPALDTVNCDGGRECLPYAEGVKGGVDLGRRSVAARKLPDMPQDMPTAVRPGIESMEASNGSTALQYRNGRQFSLKSSDISVDATHSSHLRMQGNRYEFTAQHRSGSIEGFGQEHRVMQGNLTKVKIRKTGPGKAALDLQTGELPAVLRMGDKMVGASLRRLEPMVAEPRVGEIIVIRKTGRPQDDLLLLRLKNGGAEAFSREGWVHLSEDALSLSYADATQIRFMVKTASTGKDARYLNMSMTGGNIDYTGINGFFPRLKFRFAGSENKIVTEVARSHAELGGFPGENAPVLKLSREKQSALFRQGGGDYWLAEPAKWTEQELLLTRQTQKTALHQVNMTPPKSRTVWLGDDNKPVMASRKKSWSEKPAATASELLKQDGQVRGMVFNKKSKGIRLGTDNFMEVPKKMSEKQKQIFREAADLLNERPQLAEFYRNLDGYITAADNAAFRAIHPDNVNLLHDYLALRRVKASDLDGGRVVVSLRSGPANVQYMYKDKSGNIEIVSLNAFDKTFEPAQIDSRLFGYSMQNFIKATAGEAELLADVCKKTKARTLITIEPEGEFSFAKIAALHDDIVPQNVRIIKDNPDLPLSVRFAAETVVPVPAKTVILLAGDEIELGAGYADSLRTLGYAVEADVTVNELVAWLQNPARTQIVLVPKVDDEEYPGTDDLLYMDEGTSISRSELTDRIRQTASIKDYLYLAETNAAVWQGDLSRTGKFRRVIAESLDEGPPEYVKNFLDRITLSRGKTSIDDILHRMTREEVKKARSPFSFILRLRAIPDLKADVTPVMHDNSAKG